MTGIREILKHTDFYEKYTVEQFANWQMIASHSAPPTKSLASADLVIYQPLSDVHGCFSTNPSNPDNMLKVCKSDVVTISIPRIHNNSLWPIFRKNQNNIYYGGNNFADKSLEELLYLYDSGNLDFGFEERYQKNKKISLEREMETDIKVIDHIDENNRKKRMFLTQDHPTTDLFIHCTRQVCDILDIEFPRELTLDDNIAGTVDSVYNHPSCRYPGSTYANRHFGFEWDTSVDDIFYRNVLIAYRRNV
jgi:hypothetical protein